MSVVLKVLVKKGPLAIDFLKGGPNEMGNPYYGHFGYFVNNYHVCEWRTLSPEHACVLLNPSPI